jgi:ubiquinone/menaquinone biosynthesis C-methylase UbiE
MAEVLSLLNLRGVEQILDVGCGNGKTTTEVAVRIPKGTVVGVDASAEMIGFAVAHCDAALHSNLRFAVADARYLPFEEEFDLVVSFNAVKGGAKPGHCGGLKVGQRKVVVGV